jgi:hypothetical protein
MQYYRHPKDADFGALFASLDVLMASVDHVLEFRVLGGETFMNPQAHRYIEKLREYENFTRIAVYSNGTIMPTEEGMASLIREDTYLRVTDYGPLSRKVRAIVEAFQIRGGELRTGAGERMAGLRQYCQEGALPRGIGGPLFLLLRQQAPYGSEWLALHMPVCRQRFQSRFPSALPAGHGGIERPAQPAGDQDPAIGYDEGPKILFRLRLLCRQARRGRPPAGGHTDPRAPTVPEVQCIRWRTCPLSASSSRSTT